VRLPMIREAVLWFLLLYAWLLVCVSAFAWIFK
jgi:hypothetical protein